MISNVIPPEMTPPITFLRGEYALWKYHIPYYSAVLPMKFVAEKFKLVDEIQGSESIEWSIDELFQRDIAWERIDKELIKYLKNENRPQFFNALTIALLPVLNGSLSDKYEVDSIYEMLNEESLDQPIQIGGIQIQSYKGSNGTAGKLRWDVNKVIAVAVDGQHRLAAIKKLYEQISPEKLVNTSVPVILLLPDARVGYIEPQQPENERTVIASLRRVFIDLNKNARPVSRARNILLDDLDVPSVCVRSLIDDRLSATPSRGKLPLSVVDWVSEKNKFDTGPFITTILTLHELVVEILDSDGHFDLSSADDRDVKKWLVNKFGINGAELVELMDRVSKCYYQEIPLTFQPSEIAILRNHFEEMWLPNIIKIFTEITPYKRIIEYGASNGLHKPEFVNLYIAEDIVRGEYGLNKSAKIKANLKLHNETWKYEDDYKAHIERINSNFKDGLWAFKVVFQKALFYSYSTSLEQADDFIEEGLDVSKKISQFTDMWIEAINELFKSGLGVVEAKLSGSELFWAGIGLSADGNIEYTKVAARRISNWLNAWMSMYWMEEIPTYKNMLGNEYDGIYQLCFNSLDQSGIKKLVRSRDEKGMDSQEFESEVIKQVEIRYNKMRKELKKE